MAGQVSEAYNDEQMIDDLVRIETKLKHCLDESSFEFGHKSGWESGYSRALKDAARVAQQFAEVSEGAGKTSALAIAAELKRRSLAKGKEGAEWLKGG